MGIYSVLITGANRGIGLEFVKQFIKLGSNDVNYIIAACRNPEKADELISLAKFNNHLSILELDLINYSKYEEFKNNLYSIVGDRGLDLLINNAGIFIKTEFNEITPNEMIKNFEVNTVTPLMLTKSLLPILKLSVENKKRTVVANISSELGSISDNKFGGFYPYRASKAALNQVTKCLSIDLKKFGIECTAIHPGWVKTELGGPTAPMTTERSVTSVLSFLIDPKKELNGKFLNFDGTIFPW